MTAAWWETKPVGTERLAEWIHAYAKGLSEACDRDGVLQAFLAHVGPPMAAAYERDMGHAAPASLSEAFFRVFNPMRETGFGVNFSPERVERESAALEAALIRAARESEG